MAFKMKLMPNDQVGLICPGSACREANHPQLAKEYLKQNYNLQSHYASDTIQGISPEKRADILLEYLFNDEIKLIAILRGGEGTADIVPYIHKQHEKIKRLPPKFLLGLSDFTALLIYFSQYYDWPVIHGPSPMQFISRTVDEASEKMTMDLLFGKKENSALHNLRPLNDFARDDKYIESEITGGNLSLLNISIKDIWEVNMANKIVFLEDVGEKAHKIIRTLKYFSRIGLFSSAKAVIFGDFTCDTIGCTKEEQATNREAIMKMLTSFAIHHDFPVLYTDQIGHGKTNLPLVYSTRYQLQLGEQASLKILSCYEY